MALRVGSKEFTIPTAGSSGGVAGCLGPVVDRIRDLYACLGVRRYVVRLVKTRWTGGERGDGVEEVVSETVLVPIPRVSDVSNMSATNTAVGEVEMGQLTVSEISTRYTEDELMGRGPAGEPIADDENFYWEVEFVGRNDPMPMKRRFTTNSPPNLTPDKFQWSIKLTRAIEDRSRSGQTEG